MEKEREGDFFHFGISKYKEGVAFYRLPNKLHLLTFNVCNEEDT